jgi:hypothetical protein
MTHIAPAEDGITVDVPISELHVTDKGREALEEGSTELAPEALDILFAVAYWEDTYGTSLDPPA